MRYNKTPHKYKITDADRVQEFRYRVTNKLPLVGERASQAERKKAFSAVLSFWKSKSVRDAFIYGGQVAGLFTKDEADKLRSEL